MKIWQAVIALLLAAVSAPAQDQRQTSIVRLDSRLASIVLPGTSIERLADAPDPGLREGPVWVRKGGYLLYSDHASKSLLKWNPNNTVATFLKDTDSGGVTLDDKGRIVWASGGGQVVRAEQDGTRTVLASEYDGKPLRAPNDLVYKSDGALYFTEQGSFQRDKDQNVTFPGGSNVYVLKQGKLRLVTNEFPRANGLAFSPDEKYL